MAWTVFCVIVAAFNQWNDDERNVNVNRNKNDWNDNWWFGGVRKSLYFPHLFKVGFLFMALWLKKAAVPIAAAARYLVQ